MTLMRPVRIMVVLVATWRRGGGLETLEKRVEELERRLAAASAPRVRGRKRGTFYLPGLGREREEAGLSMRQLAEEAGVTLDTVWRLEHQQRGAESRTRKSLAKALGTTVQALRMPDKEDAEM